MKATRPRTQPMTLVLSVALGATVAAMLYLAVTSLPYLSASPTSDPTFGVSNACLIQTVPSRVGFAVSFDAGVSAAWNDRDLVRCTGAEARTWHLPGVTHAAFDLEGGLWAVQVAADGGAGELLALDEPTPLHRGESLAQAIAGVAGGVVLWEATGRLLSVRHDGAVSGLFEGRPVKGGALTASPDGRLVALVAAGGVMVFDAQTLAVKRSEAPCAVEALWWLREGHRALLSCGPNDNWSLVFDFDSGTQVAGAGKVRAPSVLAGPGGPWVQPCDMLPCTAVPP